MGQTISWASFCPGGRREEFPALMRDKCGAAKTSQTMMVNFEVGLAPSVVLLIPAKNLIDTRGASALFHRFVPDDGSIRSSESARAARQPSKGRARP
jgi:hypothetical protein